MPDKLTTVITHAASLKLSAYKCVERALTLLEIKMCQPAYDLDKNDVFMLRIAQQILTDLAKDDRDEAIKIPLESWSIEQIRNTLKEIREGTTGKQLEDSRGDMPSQTSARKRRRIHSGQLGQ